MNKNRYVLLIFITLFLLSLPLYSYSEDKDNLSLFLDAIYNGDIKRIRELSASVDINSDLSEDLKKPYEELYPAIKFNKPITPLSIAILKGEENIIPELLKLGADAKKAANMLAFMVLSGTDLTELFLKEGIDYNTLFYLDEKRNILPISAAIERDNFKLTEKLLDYGADLNLSDNLYITPMNYAAGKGRKYVDLLIKYGGDVNAGTIGFPRPISSAANEGNLDLVKYLISKGAEVDFVENSNIFLIALENKSRELAKLAIKSGAVKGEPKEFMERVLMANDTFFVEILLQNGYKLNDEYVGFAITTSKVDVVKLLFDRYGAELSKRNMAVLVAALYCREDEGFEIYEYLWGKNLLTLESSYNEEYTFEGLINNTTSYTCADISDERTVMTTNFPTKYDKLRLISRLKKIGHN
jgi:ankyrin repeat protein